MSTVPRSVPDPALATVLRRLRKEHGESLESLAHRAGITASSLHRIELGQASPAWATVRALARALDTTMVELSAAVEREK
jgi:transcriptional regulator with XRE-family HTH domain